MNIQYREWYEIEYGSDAIMW